MQPYPPIGVKYQISRGGGAWPVWGLNGTELIYRLSNAVSSTNKLNAVTITTKTRSGVLEREGFNDPGFRSGDQ